MKTENQNQNENEMSTIEINLDEFSKEELISVIVAANKLDITFNEFINRVLSNAVKQFEKLEDNK